MFESTRDRLIGLVLFVGMLLPISWLEIGGWTGKILKIGAGALLGFSLMIALTGDRLWDSDTWWASKSPL
jgi:uncharacterized membrane protein YccC